MKAKPMKTLLIAGLLMVSGAANAHDWYHSRGGYGYNNGISPGAAAVIGGIIGYGMGRSTVPPAPIYYPPAPVYNTPMPPAPPGFTYTGIWNPSCNCYQYVLVPY